MQKHNAKQNPLPSGMGSINPKVSVIIPTYNRAGELIRAINSVLVQAFDDYEVIVVDDGSTDNTEQVVSKMPVRYIYQDHGGAPVARNRGIKEAQGEYIAFLDSDDWFLPGKLEKQVAMMGNSPQVMLSHTSYQHLTDGKEAKIINSGKFAGDVYPRIWFRCPICMSTVMVRAPWLKLNGFREDIDCSDDHLLWVYFAMVSMIGGIDIPLSCVSVSPNTNALNAERQLKSIYNTVEYGIKRDKNLSLPMRIMLMFYWKVLKRIYWRVK